MAGPNVSEVEDPANSKRIFNAQMQAIKVMETFKPASTTKKGNVLHVEVGRQVSGWLRIKVKGKAGEKIELQYVSRKNRGARCKDIYTLKGGEEEIWEPRFTYHGFYAVEIKGNVKPEDIEVRMVHSDVGFKNTFKTSNDLFNRLAGMYRLSQRGNMMSIPTDCNQRDERQAWGADAVVTVESAMYFF